MAMRLILILLALSSVCSFAQTDSGSVVMDPVRESSMFFPDMLSTHPLGIFMSRISHNFQTESPNRASVSFNISSGNVWLPYVKGYLPQDESDIAAMKNLEWSEREYNYDTINSPSKTMDLHADGVFRSYQVRISLPLSKSWELTAKLRAFSVDRGNIPFSTLTSDQFIEWFHSSIKGGEDPFARKYYGLNKTNISYTDQNGRTLYLQNGDFVFSGIEFSGAYYPRIRSLIRRDIFLNGGFLAGINTSKINPCIDLGLSASISKQIRLGRESKIQIGASGGIIRQNSVALGEGVQISNKNYFFTSEFLLGYNVKTRKGNQISIGTTYFLQSTYNERGDFNSMVLTGNRVSTHWHYALSHLYRRLTYNTLFISYSKGFFSVAGYIKEDLFVDNAPDAQTGVAVRFNLKYQIRQDRL